MIIKTDIREKAMTVQFSSKCWTARKFDKAATTKHNADQGADSDASRINKLLIPKSIIDGPVKARQNAQHKVHDLLASPWNADGVKILKATVYEEYATRMAAAEEVYWEQVDQFMTRYQGFYDNLWEKGPERMGGMYDRKDYPTPQEVRTKFTFKVHYAPITHSGDWRIGGLSGDETKALAAAVAERERELLAAAMKSVWKRLHTVVSNVVSKLSREIGSKESVYRDTLLGNVIDLCGLLPDLNLEDDPQLEELRKEVEQAIGRLDPELCRTDPVARKQAAEDTKEILDKIGGYF
jgi:hypothetical protein